MDIALIILAAGKGTRMRSEQPKVLHPIGGVPMLAHVLHTAQALSPARTVIVTGHGSAAVGDAARAVAPEAILTEQSEQLGTGHAAAQAAQALDGFDGLALVLFGDTPFLSVETLQAMRDAAQQSDVVVLGFEPADPARYGRLVMGPDGLEKIVEYKDASADERAIRLCNGGLLACAAPRLFELLAQVSNANASGEYYLTDVVALARAQGLTATAVTCAETETIGINTRAQLARAEGFFQERMRARALENGVTLVAPETVYFAWDTALAQDVLIEPHVVFGPGVRVESGARLRAFSHLEGCTVRAGAEIGPYARLRPGAVLGENTRIGNFVEIKKAVINPGAKVNHLSYIGDAHVGAEANIGAGTITCNYDGVSKHHTEIGAGAFIGSNTMLVAPVEVGAGALTGSGSVITENVPENAISVARAPQVTRPGMARKLFDLLRAKANQKDKG